VRDGRFGFNGLLASLAVILTLAVREIEAIQGALPADIELWLGGADAGRAAADVRAVRGWVVDDLNTTKTELGRIAGGQRAAPDPGSAVESMDLKR
jgi:hypothetical protein